MVMYHPKSSWAIQHHVYMENICKKKPLRNKTFLQTQMFLTLCRQDLKLFLKQWQYRLKSGYRPESEQSCEDKSCFIFFYVPLPFPQPISVVSLRTTYSCSLHLYLYVHVLPSARSVLVSLPLVSFRESFSFKNQKAPPPGNFPDSPPPPQEVTSASFVLLPTQKVTKVFIITSATFSHVFTCLFLPSKIVSFTENRITHF